MYRAPDTTPRCPSCGGASLTPETKFDPSEGFSYVHFGQPTTRSSFLGGEQQTLEVARYPLERARVCLDCGEVRLSFSKRRLAQLRSDLPGLVALAEE